MRLLHTTDLTLHTYYSSPPKYAILSHTWLAEGECTFQDLENRQNLDKPGWIKIRSFCVLARWKGYDYVWIDTCCIDKTSSAELQEAINSMFAYYRDSDTCFVYLADVEDRSQYRDGHAFWEAFVSSRWFTRAWTLQELLAPRDGDKVEFWSKHWWIMLGTRKGLAMMIARATDVPEKYLKHHGGRFPFAMEIMQWASSRECTREEDHAYSLLGLLNVNMPLLYGEGSNAFKCLQQEILTTSDDESILA
jgi:hypothetical protein